MNQQEAIRILDESCAAYVAQGGTIIQGDTNPSPGYACAIGAWAIVTGKRRDGSDLIDPLTLQETELPELSLFTGGFDASEPTCNFTEWLDKYQRNYFAGWLMARKYVHGGVL